MRLQNFAVALLLASLLSATVRADTYSTFQTTRYYSANRKYFVVVTDKRQATLYRNRHPLRKVWTRQLADLPGEMFVSNDGKRAVIVDRYYGNNHDPSLNVVVLLNKLGQELASYQLEQVANLKKVQSTISSSHWYSDAAFSPDQSSFLVQTLIRKRDCPPVIESPEEADECLQSVPYERLKFSASTGELVERVRTQQ